MPQLDYVIIFSQIFWLFIIFTTFYTILTHFFLPRFLKILKSRKQIIEFNTTEIEKITKKSKIKYDLIQKVLVKNLALTRNILTNNSNIMLQVKKNSNILKMDEKVGVAAFSITKYCDIQLLNFISLQFKLLSLKFN